MKYQLSPILEFIESSDVQSQNLQLPFEDSILKKIQTQELFLIGNVADNLYFILNPTIRYFLELFQKSNTFNDSLKQFADLAQCTEGEAEPIVKTFFDDMRHRDIIISTTRAKKLESVQSIQSDNLERTFVHFEIIKNLKDAPNNFTYVQLAKDTLSQELVVLKRLIFDVKTSRKEQKYWKKVFNQEFEIMLEIGSHPYINDLKSWDTEGGYAVLEFIDGKGLREYIEQYELSWEQQCHIITQVIEAMAFVHRKGVLHGDIHASNFLIDAYLNTKLIDFDLANREKPLRHEWVNEGGVFEYIPPEKINKSSFEIIKERSDYRSEVYQLGVILYIVFYKKLPFNALTWHELTDKILKNEPEYGLLKNENSAVIISFLKKCFNKNPFERFSDADKMLTAWKAFF